MWLITRRGFVSAVAERRPGPHKGQIAMRARQREHLDGVLALLEGEKPEIAISTDSDYRYRVWIAPERFVQLAGALAAEAATYSNFKDEVMRYEGRKKKASRYENALHSIWTTLGRLQPGGPYGTGGAGFPAIPKGEPTRQSRFTQHSQPKKGGGGKKKTKTKTCDECGHSGPADEFETLVGETLCSDVQACLTRLDEQGRLPQMSL